MDETVLNAEVARLIGQGYQVESRSPGFAVLVKPDRIGWFWNTVLVFVTGGLWLIYVIYKLVNRKASRVTLSLLPDGRVQRS